MREIHFTTKFKRDFKRENKGNYRGEVKSLVDGAIVFLEDDKPLPESYCDHPLTGEWNDHRDCHLKPDLILIYLKTEDDEGSYLTLVRLGSHSELGI